MHALVQDCPAIGETYRLLARIGEGTFGSVYKAQSRARATDFVALKRIYVNSAPSRIENEAAFLDELGYGDGVSRCWVGGTHADPPVGGMSGGDTMSCACWTACGTATVSCWYWTILRTTTSGCAAHRRCGRSSWGPLT
jgi:hypothetical protein